MVSESMEPPASSALGAGQGMCLRGRPFRLIDAPMTRGVRVPWPAPVRHRHRARACPVAGRTEAGA